MLRMVTPVHTAFSPLSLSWCSRAGKEEAGLEDPRVLDSAPVGGFHVPHVVSFFLFCPSQISPLCESTALCSPPHLPPMFSLPDPRPAHQVALVWAGLEQAEIPDVL